MSLLMLSIQCSLGLLLFLFLNSKYHQLSFKSKTEGENLHLQYVVRLLVIYCVDIFLSPISYLFVVVHLWTASTYTQLGTRSATSQGSYNATGAIWPQWHAVGSEPSPDTTAQQSQAVIGLQQQPTGVASSVIVTQHAAHHEEFSDMFRMLDTHGGEFNDLTGMFNAFSDWRLLPDFVNCPECICAAEPRYSD